ncbi:tripeptidyl-peptidase [Apiospora phragmitis]|uniref:tripeptidyl-peptidase II n=1 Tax=Apiospora phragmitis TaxID=2905665 RepID=A0ABR1VUC7_9PEZI
MLTLLALCAGVAAGRVVDSLDAVPRGWTFVRDAAPSDPILLRVALRQQRAAALEQAVLEISTPGHANYGMHLSRDEVRAFTAPSKQAATSVTNWIAGSGIEPTVDNDFITINTTVAKADALLETTFAWYQYEDSAEPRLRTLAYSVPDELVAHVDMVQPTTRFGRFSAKKSTVFEVHFPDDGEAKKLMTAQAADAVSCSPVTPACLKSLYNINYTAPSTGNLLAVASYLEEYARYSDLQSFESKYVPAAKGQNFTVQLANGGLDDQDSSDSSVEANLDLQYVVGVAQPIPVVEYSTGGRTQPTPPGDNEPYLEFLTYILAQDDADLPQTLSTSYGEEEQSIPREYALKVCNMFMQLGARGVSVLFSSGDSGPGAYCIRNTDNATFFEASFPAACPYVTAVGGTTGVGPERGTDFSGGGFSTFWERPAWQEKETYAAFFNATGRAIPDVAAQASNFAVIDKGREIRVGGTSASGPAFAGVIALLNAARKSQGQPPLGFLNPWLYNNSAAFTDITAGYSAGCSVVPGGARWNATAGWDTVTGLGTPNFGVMLEAAAPGVPNA